MVLAENSRALKVVDVQPPVPRNAGGAFASIEEHEYWPVLSGLPLRVDARVSLQPLTVGRVLSLRIDDVLLGAWKCSDDIQLSVKGIPLGLAEFEVSSDRRAVRIGRLA